MPTITWFGGAACSPSAWRTRESTMMIRVKLVISNKTAGRNDSAVKISSVWIGTDQVVPPLAVWLDCRESRLCAVASGGSSAARTAAIAATAAGRGCFIGT